jgi:MFS family permease
MIFFIYFFDSIDRSNLGNAKTDGMDTDLRFTGNQYSTLVMVSYISFCGLCLPANLITRKFQPKWFLVSFMLGCGILATSTAAAKNFAQLVAIRIMLGIFESVFAPCIMFYMSTFWTKGELATRFAIWYTATVTSGAFSGSISYGLLQLKGSLHGWQYLFIVEGALTVLIALRAALVLPKTPYTTSWLSEKEKEMCLMRMRQDSIVDVGSAWSFSEGMAPFNSWQVY